VPVHFTFSLPHPIFMA